MGKLSVLWVLYRVFLTVVSFEPYFFRNKRLHRTPSGNEDAFFHESTLYKSSGKCFSVFLQLVYFVRLGQMRQLQNSTRRNYNQLKIGTQCVFCIFVQRIITRGFGSTLPLLGYFAISHLLYYWTMSSHQYWPSQNKNMFSTSGLIATF